MLIRTTQARNKAVIGIIIIGSAILGVAFHFLAQSAINLPESLIFIFPLSERISLGLFALSASMLILALIKWAVRHKISRGLKYSLQHAKLLRSINKDLAEAESRYSLLDGHGQAKLIRLPKIKLELSKNLKSGTLKIKNHILHSKVYDNADWSSCLGKFIVDSKYFSNDSNFLILEIINTKFMKKKVFSSIEEFCRFSEKFGDNELFIDEYNKMPTAHTLISAISGGGKSYALYNLCMQLLLKRTKPVLWFIDVKGSDLAAMGRAVAEDRTADSVEGAVELIERFAVAMNDRKPLLQEKLKQNFSASASDFGEEFSSNYLIFDEYGSFVNSISTLPKAERDSVAKNLRNIALLGRQLSFIFFCCIQQANAQTLTSDIRDQFGNVMTLGNSQASTLIVAFGNGHGLPDKNFLPGEGFLKTVDNARIRTCNFPRLDFNVTDGVRSIVELGCCNTPAT